MAWHDRKVIAEKGDRAVRTTVLFFRQDLLWLAGGIINPYDKQGMPLILPLKLPSGALVGPNIFDIIKKEPIPKPAGTPKNEPIKHKLILRPTNEYFENPKKLKDKSVETSKDALLNPFKKGLSTLGRRIEEYDDFVRVEKRSSVSISRLVLLLACGMWGEQQAFDTIREMASEAWERDLARAERLYKLVKAMPDGVPVESIQESLEATSTISQEVEERVLSEACRWMDIDPNTVIQRQRGRPAGSRQTGDNSQSGTVLKMTITNNNEIEGVFIINFAGYKKGSSLKNLGLKSLAELLVKLQNEEHLNDTELLEAYLEAIDSNWRDTILEGSESIPEGSIIGHDAYAILGVDKNASFDDIKKAYKKAIRQVHPDKSGLSNYFAQLVNNAYRLLREKFKDEQ